MSRVRTARVTSLESRHPTDSHWWGKLHLEPAGKTQVHVYAAGTVFGREGTQSASLPFVELDELQELIDRARVECAAAGFVDGHPPATG